MTNENYEAWLNQVRNALNAINMPIEDWQEAWAFDFRAEYRSGATPGYTARRVNRFWWRNQNLALRQNCTRTPDCWLPREHQGKCEPVS